MRRLVDTRSRSTAHGKDRLTILRLWTGVGFMTGRPCGGRVFLHLWYCMGTPRWNAYGMGDASASGRTRPARRARRFLAAVAIVMAIWLITIMIGRLSTPTGTNAVQKGVVTAPTPTVTEPGTVTLPSVRRETALPPFGGIALTGLDQGSVLSRQDDAAATGAWTVVVRRDDGSLGRNGAVVTFPVDPSQQGSGGAVRVGSQDGFRRPGVLVWPLSSLHARIRGDLPDADLLRIAQAITTSDGRPAMTVAPEGFRVIGSSPSRLSLIHEIRYHNGELGFTYSGLTAGGGFEDALYTVGVTPVGRVRGADAVASIVWGGSGTVAWEPTPGLVAYVGWSGNPISDSTSRTALNLARGASFVTPQEWVGLGPVLVEQNNDVAAN